MGAASECRLQAIPSARSVQKQCASAERGGRAAGGASWRRGERRASARCSMVPRALLTAPASSSLVSSNRASAWGFDGEFAMGERGVKARGLITRRLARPCGEKGRRFQLLHPPPNPVNPRPPAIHTWNSSSRPLPSTREPTSALASSRLSSSASGAEEGGRLGKVPRGPSNVTTLAGHVRAAAHHTPTHTTNA